MSFASQIVDVARSTDFASSRFSVGTDARGLSAERMQAIERGYNIAEGQLFA